MQGHISCMEAMQTKEQTGKKSELISFWVLWICRSHRLWLAVVVASWYSPSKRNFSEIYQVARPRAIETSLLVQIELVQLSSCTKATAFYYSKRMFLMFSFFFFSSLLQNKSEIAVAGHCHGMKESEESYMYERNRRDGVWSKHKERKTKWFFFWRDLQKERNVRGKGK